MLDLNIVFFKFFNFKFQLHRVPGNTLQQKKNIEKKMKSDFTCFYTVL